MIATKRMINQYRRRGRLNIDSELERYILSEYGEEPFPYVWTEQDLSEQIGGLIRAYNRGEFTIPWIPSKSQRFRDRREWLQNELIDLSKLYYNCCCSLPERFSDLSVVVVRHDGGGDGCD